jgi:hypothetical protein
MTEDLILWLTQRLDEDEQIARATMLTTTDKGEWTVTTDPHSGDDKPTGVLGTCIYIGMIGSNGDLDDPAQAIHIAEHDPARVLREVEAKRKILDRWAELIAEVAHWRACGDEDAAPVATEWAYRQVAVQLASVYSDRPGFKEEWRIEP